MELEFWKDRWENNNIGFHRESVNPLLKNNFTRLALQQGEKILVPLCGKSLDLTWLASQGFKIDGIEKYLSSDFNSFLPELDTIIQQWEQMKGVADAAKRMDLLDVIQSVIQRFQSFPDFSTLIAGGDLDVIGQAFQTGGGWDPSFLMSIDIPIIKEKIQNVFIYIKNYYNTYYPDQLPGLMANYIYPYIKTDWERIKEVGLDDIFINTLL